MHRVGCPEAMGYRRRMGDKSEGLPSRRYKELVGALRDALSASYGWKKKAAVQLGVAPSYVSKIANGNAGEIGPSIIERAVKRLQIPTAWFYDEKAVPDWESAVSPATGAAGEVQLSDLGDLTAEGFARRQKIRAAARAIVDGWSRGADVSSEARALATLLSEAPAVRVAREVLAADEKAIRDKSLSLAVAALAHVGGRAEAVLNDQ